MLALTTEFICFYFLIKACLKHDATKLFCKELLIIDRILGATEYNILIKVVGIASRVRDNQTQY